MCITHVEPVVCWYGLHYLNFAFRNRLKVIYIRGSCSLYTYAKGLHASNTASKGFTLLISTAPHTIIPSVCKSVFYCYLPQQELSSRKRLPTHILLGLYMLSYYTNETRNVEVDSLASLFFIREVPSLNTARRPANLIFTFFSPPKQLPR